MRHRTAAARHLGAKCSAHRQVAPFSSRQHVAWSMLHALAHCRIEQLIAGLSKWAMTVTRSTGVPDVSVPHLSLDRTSEYLVVSAIHRC